MKPTGFSVIYINGSPHISLHAEDGHEWPVFTLEDAEKALRFLAQAIDQVKTDQQKRKLQDHLDAMPDWKRNVLNAALSQPLSLDD